MTSGLEKHANMTESKLVFWRLNFYSLVLFTLIYWTDRLSSSKKTPEILLTATRKTI
jgi:hypothetical protein